MSFGGVTMFRDNLAPWELDGLKAASRVLIERLGKYEVAALIAGRAASQLHAYANLAKPDFMPVDVLLRLERAYVEGGGRPILSALLARGVGHMQVPVPAGAGEVPRELAALLREAAELAAGHVEASADGALSEQERATLAAHVDVLVALGMRLRAALAGPAAEG
jgi:hypothetical protein